MYVGDTLADRIGEEAVDELDDRRGVDFLLKCGEAFILLFFLEELEIFFEKVAENDLGKRTLVSLAVVGASWLVRTAVALYRISN